MTVGMIRASCRGDESAAQYAAGVGHIVEHAGLARGNAFLGIVECDLDA